VNQVVGGQKLKSHLVCLGLDHTGFAKSATGVAQHSVSVWRYRHGPQGGREELRLGRRASPIEHRSDSCAQRNNRAVPWDQVVQQKVCYLVSERQPLLVSRIVSLDQDEANSNISDQAPTQISRGPGFKLLNA